MPHELSLRLPGDPTYSPLAARLLQEVSELPEGPDEEIVEPLLATFERLVARMLAAVRDAGGGQFLSIDLALAGDGLAVSLAVLASNGDAASNDLLAEDDPALQAARKAFDSVDVGPGPTGAVPGSGLVYRLTVGSRQG